MHEITNTFTVILLHIRYVLDFVSVSGEALDCPVDR